MRDLGLPCPLPSSPPRRLPLPRSSAVRGHGGWCWRRRGRGVEATRGGRNGRGNLRCRRQRRAPLSPRSRRIEARDAPGRPGRSMSQHLRSTPQRCFTPSRHCNMGTLPFRLLAAEYGADITYGEEIIDHKFLKCERVINETLGATDFVEKGTDSVVFRTCPQERDRVVFQMGTSHAVRALKAAEIVCHDVAAIDINMGCPKSFSLSGGMGAALLSKPELIHDILTTLRRNLDTTVTCKIRLLNTPKDTVELARRIEKTGVPALAVHGRKIKDRPRDPAKWDEIADVVSALSIPVIANGDVFEYEHFKRIKDATGAASVMVARGAMWNASVFSAKGKTPYEEVKREYVRKSILWDNDVKSTKHTLKEMIMHYSCLELPEGKGVIKCDSSADIARLYGEEDYYNFVVSNRK